MSANPYILPSAYDAYTLDYVQAPGISWVESGGERVEEYQDQQVPMTTGATTLFRFEPNGEITYTHKLWLPSHFPAWQSYVAMLLEGKSRRPQPRVYVLADERLADVQMTTVGLKAIGPRKIKRGGETLIKVSYKEVRKQKPYGGPAGAGSSMAEKAIDELRRENAALKERIDAAVKAGRAGK